MTGVWLLGRGRVGACASLAAMERLGAKASGMGSIVTDLASADFVPYEKLIEDVLVTVRPVNFDVVI